MAEVAVSQVEKDALLQFAEGLLDQVYKPTEPRQAESKPSPLYGSGTVETGRHPVTALAYPRVDDVRGALQTAPTDASDKPES